MRIAMLAPIGLPVPPVGYGGTERVVSLLTEGLVARGHEVTLFASGDSETRGELRARFARHLELDGPIDKVAYQRYEAEHVAWAFAQAGEFDLVHDHTKALGTLYSRFSRVPVVTTIHNDFTPERRAVYGAYRDHAYVAISRSHAARMPELAFAGVVYNGIDLAETQYREQKDGYLLFLGRLDPAKGAATAMQVALALDMPLVMAGRVAPDQQAMFDREIAPHLDGVKRRFVGEVNGHDKWALYSGASALIFPIRWPEPFGLVMVEAMAAGTPVVATRWGSVPEVVEDGVTGVITPADADVDALAAASRRALTLSPQACRARVEQLFSADKMVEDYLAVYERLLASRAGKSAVMAGP